MVKNSKRDLKNADLANQQAAEKEVEETAQGEYGEEYYSDISRLPNKGPSTEEQMVGDNSEDQSESVRRRDED